MSYYVRVFCRADESPPLCTVIDYVTGDRPQLSIVSDDALNYADWEGATMTYKANKQPILVECNRNTGEEDCLAAEELAEFVELAEDSEDSPGKQQVIAHLRATKFIVACRLPTSDIDDDGYEANSQLLNYFVEHCGGMIQADGEGFYREDEVILPVE